jgi:carbamoyl-phosphate synthase small subunit
MTEALVVLEDGTAFRGRSFGARGEAFGELVFTTAMSGFQEVLTDPSYARQLVVMTSSHIGNYGAAEEEAESDRVWAAGLVVREASRGTGGRPDRATVGDQLREAGVPGVEGVDTRALTLHIREAGAMRAAISTEDLDPASVLSRVRGQPGMEGADLASSVSTGRRYRARDVIGPAASGRTLRVAAYDWGIKRSMLRHLAALGCEVTVVPASTAAEEVLAEEPDGVFLSNGPGDPAATRSGIEAVRRLLGRVPVFGVCLGHQILGLAAGGRSRKLKFGHRGTNQPVIDLDTGKVEVTSHNHGFALDPTGFAGAPSEPPSLGPAPVVSTDLGPAALTHWNLNDGTLEGLRLLEAPAFGVQFHPEAAPGPHDAAGSFVRFVRLMEQAA